MRFPLALVLLAGCGRLGFATHDVDAGLSDVAPSDASPDAPARPITFVQNANSSAMVPQLALDATFDQPLQPGALVLVGLDYSFDHSAGVVTPTMSDSLASTYVLAVPSDNELDYGQYVFFAVIPAGGPDTVTVTLSGDSNDFIELRLLEYGGPTTLDATSIAAGGAVGDGPVFGMPVTTTSSDELLVVLAVAHGGVVSVGTGFTLRTAFDEDVMEDRPAPVPATYGVSAGMKSGSQWTLSAAAFR